MSERRSTTGLRVLLVGGGGREHAIAWKLAQSPLLARLWIAPGNPGTALSGTNIEIPAEDISALLRFAQKESIDLVFVGPEAPLTLGIADAFFAAEIPVFGPSAAAARIESSKVFAKEFARRYSIPTAQFKTFDNFEEASLYLDTLTTPFVIKASGLASGKGVFLPESIEEARKILADLLLIGSLGESGRQVVIEERLTGEEISLMAFSDGHTLAPMLLAQDHKRLLDGDRGPNTGGMGAYAPAPFCSPEQTTELIHSILQPAIDGLRAEGSPFVGVLYAGLMLTSSGAQLLEFNCRFGDPEAQVVLPLLESDLLQIAMDCVNGVLRPEQVRWRAGCCACVVLASQNYPASASPVAEISGLETTFPYGRVFQAGTKLRSGKVVASGGRVLGITAWGDDLRLALDRAYAIIQQVSFQGMQYRRDIGGRGLRNLSESHSVYAAAGVNIDAGSQAVNLMREAVRTTYTSSVLAGIGAFGGLFDASIIKQMKRPVLAASIDGIGTKVLLAARTGRFRSLGQDIVNHCVNDILVQGARPLLFLDYFATSRLQPEVVAEIVSGMAEACCEAGCSLIGGETAEMPGVYQSGEFDVAGAILGVVEYERILPRSDLKAGDILLGLRSSGPHTNGYSLLRKVFADTPLDRFLPELGSTLEDALLAPHRSYLPLLAPILEDSAAPIKALAHITGGGLIDNIPRILPPGLTAHIFRDSWPVPTLFQMVQTLGKITTQEMARVFNLGIGMVVVLSPASVPYVQDLFDEESWVIGELSPGEKKVVIV